MITSSFLFNFKTNGYKFCFWWNKPMPDLFLPYKYSHCFLKNFTPPFSNFINIFIDNIFYWLLFCAYYLFHQRLTVRNKKDANYFVNEGLTLCQSLVKIQLLEIDNQVVPCGIESKINFYNFTTGARKYNKELEISLDENQCFIYQILIVFC